MHSVVLYRGIVFFNSICNNGKMFIDFGKCSFFCLSSRITVFSDFAKLKIAIFIFRLLHKKYQIKFCSRFELQEIVY